MARFKFRSMDRKGQLCEGTATVSDIAALTELLRQQGQFLISAAAESTRPAATAVAVAAAPPRPAPKHRKGDVKDEDIAVFNGQFALMLRSAVPLLEALSTLAQQQTNAKFRAALHDIAESIRGGSPLTAAFARFPRIFDQVYLSMLEAGEGSGTMPHMIERISEYLEFRISVRARVKSASMYPAIVMSTAFLIVLALIVFVLPVFQEVFEQFDAPLPPITIVLLGFSSSLREHALAWITGIVGAAAAARVWVKAERNRLTVHLFILNFPVLGQLTRSIILSRAMRTLAELLRAGVPVLKALKLTEATAGNEVYVRIFRRMQDEVAGGQPLWQSLAASEYVPEMVSHLVASGEKTGRLSESLSFIADYYQRQIDAALRDLFAAMEPVFVVFLGGAIGLIAIAMLLPIFRLGAIVQ